MINGKWKIVFVVVLACALAAAGALTYKRWPQLFKKIAERKPSSANQSDTSSGPPFSTKEPERYQATRIITSVENQNDSGAASETVSKILIARDGERRREERDNGTLVSLETPAGRFVLLPAKKLYADLNLAASDLDSVDPQSDLYSDFSPERLLNEASAPTRYEKLGSETVNGRSTTKYRVTSGNSTNGTSAASVTLIWIDDELGVPIRSETGSVGGDHPAKFTIELQDIKLEVDPQLFDLPKDYKKVDYRVLRAAIP